MPLAATDAPALDRALAALAEGDDTVDEHAATAAGLDAASDGALLDAVARAVAVPRTGPPDSFVLHAPLEVLARAGLLVRCSPAARPAARARLVATAVGLLRADAPAPVPDPGDDGLDPVRTAARLATAVDEGDLDRAAALGRLLAGIVDAATLTRLVGDLVVPRLSAAAHGPIFLHLLPRTAPHGAAATMFGALARELARYPEERLTWMAAPSAPDPSASAAALHDALARTPVLGPAPTTSIAPTMHHVEDAGLPAELVGPLVDAAAADPGGAARALVRVATSSMRLDDEAHAPYGWSHCLTMPLAVASIAPALGDPRSALAVAATHVVGFRATLGRAPLAELRADDAGAPASGDARSASRAVLAADPAERARLVQDVVDAAAAHHDAHLAKYVHACLDAARLDPAGAPGHLAAAAHLAAWWGARPSAAGEG